MTEEDSYTEVEHTSWWQRIADSIKGIVVGLILFGIAFPVLFWNEGRAVKRYKTLKEGAAAVISVTPEQVNPANESKLVHLSGLATTEETLSDSTFFVSAKAIKLKRTVEMYQWREETDTRTEKKLGGGTKKTTTYNYTKTWSDDLINSSQFKKAAEHRNPSSMPYETKTFHARQVNVGAFTLSASLIAKIGSYESLPIQSTQRLPAEIQENGKIHNNAYYIGQDPGAPQIGDVRITFQRVPETTVSIVAQQMGKSFSAYQTTTGGTIELLEEGTRNAQAMFQQAQHANTILTWILRVVGFIMMFIGLTMVFKPLSVFADVLPFIGSIVSLGTGVIALIISAIFATLVIAVAWIFYRPLLGISLLVVSAALVGLLVYRSKTKADAPQQATPEASLSSRKTKEAAPESVPPPPPPS